MTRENKEKLKKIFNLRIMDFKAGHLYSSDYFKLQYLQDVESVNGPTSAGSIEFWDQINHMFDQCLEDAGLNVKDYV